MIRVVLAEDNFLVREGVCGLLATSELVEVVGSCGDLAQAIDRSTAWSRMWCSPTSGCRRAGGRGHPHRRLLPSSVPDVGVVLLSQYAEASYVRTLLARAPRPWLPAQGARGRPGRSPRGDPRGGPRWLRDRSQGHRDAGQRTVLAGDSRGQAHAAGTGGARRHRAGSDERGDLGSCLTRSRGEAHHAIFAKLGLSGDRGGQQESQGHPALPGGRGRPMLGLAPPAVSRGCGPSRPGTPASVRTPCSLSAASSLSFSTRSGRRRPRRRVPAAARRSAAAGRPGSWAAQRSPGGG